MPGLRAAALKLVDQGSILLVVFTAFSAAVVEGLWRQLPASALLGLVVVCAVLLTLALDIDGEPLAVRASIGLSLFPRDAQDARTLMASADAAMYRIKQGHKRRL